jgi:hypothetical protein
VIPVGYMAKRVHERPDWINAPHIADIYSVSGCVSEDFTDYIRYWKHNGYWLFNSPEVIQNIARENSIVLDGMTLFYYEAHEMEFDAEEWTAYTPDPTFPTDVTPPSCKNLEGFDVVTFYSGTSPECSPLSCNSLAKGPAKIRYGPGSEQVNAPLFNSHCLLASFEEAESQLYSTDWPGSNVAKTKARTRGKT